MVKKEIYWVILILYCLIPFKIFTKITSIELTKKYIKSNYIKTIKKEFKSYKNGIKSKNYWKNPHFSTTYGSPFNSDTKSWKIGEISLDLEINGNYWIHKKEIKERKNWFKIDYKKEILNNICRFNDHLIKLNYYQKLDQIIKKTEIELLKYFNNLKKLKELGDKSEIDIKWVKKGIKKHFQSHILDNLNLESYKKIVSEYVNYKGELIIIDHNIPSLELILKQLKNNPSILEFDKKIKITKLKLKQKERENLVPNINISGAINKHIPEIGDNFYEYEIGLSLELPIFKDNSTLNKLKYKKIGLRYQKEILNREKTIFIKSLYKNILNLKKQLKKSQYITFNKESENNRNYYKKGYYNIFQIIDIIKLSEEINLSKLTLEKELDLTINKLFCISGYYLEIYKGDIKWEK